MLNTLSNSPSKALDWGSLTLRLGMGSYMAFGHGLPKLQQLLAGGEITFPSVLGMGSMVSLVLAVFSEFICALLVIIGLRTRLASLPLIGTMAIAALIIHGNHPWFQSNADGGSKEAAMMYLIAFVATFFLGSGRYSVDDFLNKKA